MNFQITVQPSGRVFEVERDETMLSAAIRHGVGLPYGCRDGACGSCKSKLIEGRVPIYPGIGATATGIALTADRVVGQIHHARELGVAGFTIFNFEPGTAVAIVPGVGLGAGAERAVPPHRNP